MKIVCLSDTHTRTDFQIPDGDILIHSGDATFTGNYKEVYEFSGWYSSLPHRYKIFTAGNHDWGFQKQPEVFRSMMKDSGIIYLEDSEIEIEGIKIYGSPWQPEFNSWAFNLSRYDGELAEKWSKIPDDTQILITHGPPKGILDRTLGYEEITPSGMSSYDPPRHVGCYDLFDRIYQLKSLRLHIFGHIHAAYGVEKVGNVTYANSSICNEKYKAINKPHVFDWPLK